MRHYSRGARGSHAALAITALACCLPACRRGALAQPASASAVTPSATVAASVPAPTSSATAVSAPAPSVPAVAASATAAGSAPSAGPQNERVTAYLREQNVLDAPEQYRLLDLDADGLQDVFTAAGVALQGPQSFRAVAADVSSMGSTTIGGPERTPRGWLLPIGATGHEVINDVPGRAAYSMTWMDWSVFVFEQGALRSVFSDRFDENTAFDWSGALQLVAQPDGTLVERNTLARRLRWAGDHLEADSCWGGEPVPNTVEGCTVTLTSGSHPRVTETATRERDGVELRAGSSVVVRYAGSVRRGVARMYCAHEPGTSDSYWVFLTPSELAGCPAFAL